MPKRSFILLIVILIIVVVAVFGFLYFRDQTTTLGNQNNTGGINFLAQFNPFGNRTPAGENAGTPSASEPGAGSSEEELPTKLNKISSMPIAGFAVFMKERLKEVAAPETPESETVPTKPLPPQTEFAPAVRYVERATGNIYQTFADKIEERRFSTTVIPKVYDAYFGNKGGSVAMRHLKRNERTIETFFGTLPKEKLGGDESTEIKGSFLADNIKDISVSPDTLKLFYLLETGSSESAIGTILNIADGKKTPVFDSAFTEWLSLWPNSKTITLTTKPAGEVLGYMYALDVDKKSLIRVLGGIAGLTTQMSPDGETVLYGDNSTLLYLYNMDTKTSRQAGIQTLPEKCVWNKTSELIYCAVPRNIERANYPDAWYQGEISFSDQIWKINTIDGNATLIADPLAFPEGESVDGIKLALDSDEKYLFFVNKKDSFLWKLDLK